MVAMVFNSKRRAAAGDGMLEVASVSSDTRARDSVEKKVALVNEFLRAREIGDVEAAMAMCSDMILIVADDVGDMFGDDMVEEFIVKGKGRRMSYVTKFEWNARKKVLSVLVSEHYLKVLKRKKLMEFGFDRQGIRACIVRSM